MALGEAMSQVIGGQRLVGYTRRKLFNKKIRRENGEKKINFNLYFNASHRSIAILAAERFLCIHFSPFVHFPLHLNCNSTNPPHRPRLYLFHHYHSHNNWPQHYQYSVPTQTTTTTTTNHNTTTTMSSSLAIRFQRFGYKGKPFYRIVVAPRTYVIVSIVVNNINLILKWAFLPFFGVNVHIYWVWGGMAMLLLM